MVTVTTTTTTTSTTPSQPDKPIPALVAPTIEVTINGALFVWSTAAY